MLMLFCMFLIAYAEDNNGDDDTYCNINDNDNIAHCCPCCYVAFKMPPIQKNSCFSGFPDKNFAADPQISMVFATLSQKPHQKNKTNLLWKQKLRNIVFLTKATQNSRFSGF